MQLEDLLRTASQGESSRLEFKERASQGCLSEASRTLCGMLNGVGGQVFVGVSDKGEISGQDVSDATLRRVWGALEQIQPGVQPLIEVVAVDAQRSVVVIAVSRGVARPYRVRGVAYKRVGTSTVAMTEAEAQVLTVEAAMGVDRWEDQVLEGFSPDDLDLEAVRRTVRRAVERGRIGEPVDLDPFSLLQGLGVTRDGKLTRAAAVVFGRGDEFAQAFPQCRVRLARFRGKDKSEFLDHRQEAGHIFKLMEDSLAFLRRNLPVAGRIVGGVFERQDDPVYPPEALREALANAFCHRDYTQAGGSVSVAIYDDRLEIASPGGLHFGLTVEDLYRSHESRPWNPTIAQVLYRWGLIESWGRGTVRMAELTEAVGLPRPEFEDVGNTLTVRFRPDLYVPPEKVGRELTTRQRDVLRVLAQGGVSGKSLSQVVLELGLDDQAKRSIQSELALLRQLHLVQSQGHARGARWRLADG